MPGPGQQARLGKRHKPTARQKAVAKAHAKPKPKAKKKK